MNLYLVEHPKKAEGVGYDVYDSFVCAAKDEQAARMTYPGDWMGDWGGESGSCWCSASEASVSLIGKAAKGTLAGVICASFNAG